MILIFHFSSAGGGESSGTSMRVVRVLQDLYGSIFHTGGNIPSEHLDLLHTLVRKFGHVSEYFLLGLSVSFPLRVYNFSIRKAVPLAMGICVAYACSDEIHQLFVPGRAGRPVDVLIDTIGILMGVALFHLISVERHRTTH